MATTSLPTHLPLRPSWDCGGCGKPWPCDPAREALVVECRRFPLMLVDYMAAQYMAAVDDLWPSTGLPADLYERFLTWCSRLRRDVPRPATTESLPNVGSALAWSNRAVLAQRQHWPGRCARRMRVARPGVPRLVGVLVAIERLPRL